MESLADVLKQLPQRSMLRQAEEQRRAVLADPAVADWRKRHPQVTDDELRLNVNRLYQYIVESKNCARCPGLDNCPNDLQGHYTILTAETDDGAAQLYDYKVSCNKFTAREAQNAVRRRIRSFYVDQRSLLESCSWREIAGFDLDRAEAVTRIGKYIAKTKEEGLQPQGLYLVGHFGTGKTFLLCYLLYELASAGLTGAIVYMPDFSEDLKAMFEHPQKLKETIDLLRETDLLVFDDIGAENLNPWLRDHVLGTILNYRMNRKPTFFTSNLELHELQRHFSFTNKDGEEEYKGQRIMDRIRPFVEEIVVRGDNKRGR